MPIYPARRFTLLNLCGIVVYVAIAASLARHELTWRFLDARCSGYPAAIGLYTWFWVGPALIAFRFRSIPSRFFGLAGLFLSMPIIQLLLHPTDLGHEPDYPGFCGMFMLLCCASFGIAGASAWLLAPAAVRQSEAPWEIEASEDAGGTTGDRTTRRVAHDA